ncbi:hypothetical protein BV22DRAFT_1063441 [Leucogyrophana mollusca]|uniref:Uncharacterized protein n=1 Tax=Leucogyrophana mollusca TaxID=85980 RepID=A0ACB8BL17_9AGAM|nr:hypothetical protein BV22DRAFT_1063441 [Leucogyrophana mollusca]
MSTTSAAALNGAAPSGSRSRPQARKKPNDDAAYFGPPAAGAKRQAADRAEGEPRVKRKRVDVSTNAARKAEKLPMDLEDKYSQQIEFKNMPTTALYRYLSHFNLIPMIHPSPLSAADPPAPSYLLDPFRYGSRGISPVVMTTPANRPRRDPKEQSRRRSSRLLEESQGRTPILADVAEVHAVLAEMAERHFLDHMVNEIDTLASFMVKTKCE